jgi:formylglycine-generating enzyme required for sulfatase activity
MAPPLKVFISSTYLDNAERRRRVEEAVIHARMVPVGMERFVPSANPTVADCQRQARECDIYVGIIGHRYGWIPDTYNVSITELEYDAARAAGRPCLMFEIDPTQPVRPDQDYDQGSDWWQKQGRLEAFRTKYRADLRPGLFTETNLQGRVLHALSEWCREREGAPSGPGPTGEVGHGEIDLYRLRAEKLNATLELAGFKTKLRVPVDLAELYVPLNAMVDLRAVDDGGFADAVDAERQLREAAASHEISLLEGIREARARRRGGLVILGDPGSGKTMHLKRLLLWCLRRGPAELGLEPDVLPVFLPLRDLRDVASGVGTFIEQQLDTPHLDMAAGFGQRLLARGHLLLLFDGLDEVADVGQRAEVVHWVEEVAKTWPTCTPVVTCRFAGYGGEARLGPEFLELHVRPLTDEQSQQFVRNWYRLVETGLALEPAQGEATARERSDELLAHLRRPEHRSKRLLEMTGNPLLLANLCLVHRDRGALPRGRTRLYDECIDVLLERWREGKKLPVSVSAEAGRRVLQPAALWMHGEEQRTRATVKELAPVLESALESVRWRQGGAAGFLRTVRDDSGLLTGWGQDHFGFMHLGFQEYLAASEIRRRHLIGDGAPLRALAGRYGESWWQEVILILVALGNPSLFDPFMSEVVKYPQFADDTELLNLILEEAAEVSEGPFVALLEMRPGHKEELWRRQLVCLRTLERLGFAQVLERLAERLAAHPSLDVRLWLLHQAAKRKRVAAGDVVVTENGGVELLHIPAGTFIMGSPASEEGGSDDERPQHEVTVPSFYIGRYEITNEEYGQFLEAHPEVRAPEFWSDRRFNGARQPVVGVSLEEVLWFAAWAGGRLPTEAEWEYAARAGTTAPYLLGSSEKDLARVAWYSRNAGGQTHPVGEKAANTWGLHDVLGNVWEWVGDTWHNNYERAPSDGSAWVDTDSADRVMRGGSWSDIPHFARVAGRLRGGPFRRVGGLGFRLARSCPSPG